MPKKIILFDGDCSLCNKSVQFILKRNVRRNLYFASLQSEYARQLLSSYNLDNQLNSIVFIEHSKIYTKSSAALHICKHLRHIWKWFFILIIVPKPIRDFIYHLVSSSRYQLFGEVKQCLVLQEEDRKRILTDDFSVQ